MPGGADYEAEVLDTWNGTVEKLPGTYRGRFRIELPARAYMAVRFRLCASGRAD
jgi:hypothetical protein